VCGERKTHEATQSTIGDEFRVHLEETQSSKWRESRAPRVNSRFEITFLFRQNIDMNIKNTGKHVRKERVQYIKLPPLESFRQSFRTFALSFNRIQKLHSIVIVYTIFPTNPFYMKMIPIYRKLMSPLAARVELLSPRIMDLISLKENNNFNGFTKNRKPDFAKS
jgi:hypothetical protein